jgi:hypothetical protein
VLGGYRFLWQTITAIGEFMHKQTGSEYQFLLLGSKHNVAFCCRPLSSDLAVGDPLGLPSENGYVLNFVKATKINVLAEQHQLTALFLAYVILPR